jgi:parvulin-like peptidyl-prolyl isomerase
LENSKILKNSHERNQPVLHLSVAEIWDGSEGNMVREFEEAVWQTPLKSVSPPVKTTFGYHLIWVHEREEE